MSTVLDEEERALAELFGEIPPERDEDTCVREFLPRTFRAREYFKAGSQELEDILEFERAANATPRDYGSKYLSLEWMGARLVAILERADAIREGRQRDAATSEYVGELGKAIETVARIVHVASWEDDLFGTKYLTIMRDEHGNTLKYFNQLHFLDPAMLPLEGEEPTKRDGVKGDKVKLRATVKEHDTYKGVKGTLLGRARKVELIESHAR